MTRLSNPVFQAQLVFHKKLIGRMVSLKDKDLIPLVSSTGRDLSLFYANFRCEAEGCGKEDCLQRHHLIVRRTKELTDFWRYASQRHYWANVLVLCKGCHRKVHGTFARVVLEGEGGCISQSRIDKVKKLFGVE